MNRVFKLKASIALFAVLFFQAELRAQSVSQVDTSHVLAMNIDTNITKKPSSAIVVKSDTALIVKAGATIVQKADTTMVINADPELIRKFNEIVAKQQAEQTKQTNNVTNNNATPAKTDSASKQNTFTEVKTNTPPANQSDSSALPPATLNVPVSSVNTGNTASNVVTGAATSAVTGAAKTDATIPSQSNNNNNPSATSNSQPVNNTNTSQAANNTPANKPDSVANQQPAQNNASQTASNSNAVQSNKSDSTVHQQSAKNNASQQASNSVQPSQTGSDANNSTQQTVTNNTPAAKTDSALTAISDTTKAKTDTVKKSDTTKMKKDTALMVTDTTQHVNKAVAAYLEVGGAGLAISGNYDARFHEQRDGWGYRIGAGYFASGGNTVFTVPFQIDYLTGEHSMHIELGAGTTFMNSTGTNVGNSKWEFDKITGFIATATVGFRYQPEQKGLNFRIAFVPILYDEGVIPAGGVSIGYTFK